MIVTSVQAERDAIGEIEAAQFIVSGVGRTNAAAATTEAIIRRGPFDLVINAGIAGSLPGSGLEIGDVVIASACVYAEEGLLSPDGFMDMAALGFPLGDFDGNAVPIDSSRIQSIEQAISKQQRVQVGPIATVAMCSGTDDAAAKVVRRTGAIAEAMEGAAVVHAARRLGVPGMEVRTISNTTGDRSKQKWDRALGLASLGDAMRTICAVLKPSNAGDQVTS